jgi:uncharacterized protein YwgA
MRQREDIVAAIVAAAGGRLASRVRLQKVVYLLDQLGLRSGFDFDYHNYGPYSRDLDNATVDAQAFELIEENFEHRKSDGARYSIFQLLKNIDPPLEAFGELGKDRAEELVKKLAETNVTVLELAATVDWLWRTEEISDWRPEVERRKRSKVGGGRLERAIDLLTALDLPPPESRAANAA